MDKRPQAALVVEMIDPPWAFYRIATRVKRRFDELGIDSRIVLQKELRKRDNFDLIVVFWWASGVSIRSRLGSRPFVATCFYDHFSWKGVEKARQIVSESNLILACNEKLQGELRTSFGCESHLVEDGVDTKTFSPSPLPSDFSVGWVGSTRYNARVKCQYNAVKACDELGLDLYVADPTKNPIIFEDMPEFYKGISVLLVTSKVEGTPNPLLEAMASGRPVISTRVGLAEKVIRSGENGVLVDFGKQPLVRALQAIQSSDLAVMGRLAADTTKSYDWEGKIRQWDYVAKSVL